MAIYNDKDKDAIFRGVTVVAVAVCIVCFCAARHSYDQHHHGSILPPHGSTAFLDETNY